MDNKKAKVCLILPGLDAGGIENYVLRYLHYTNDVQMVTILSRSLSKGDLYEKYLQTGVNLHQQQVGYFNPLKWFLLFRFFRNNRFTTVCDFNENFAGIPMLMAALAGVSKRITFYRRSSHAFNPSWFRLAYARLMNLLVHTYSTAILSNSRHALDFFFGEVKSRGSRFKVIPNGVNAAIFDIQLSKENARKKMSLPLGVFIIGHSGRYDSAKNHETWFKVAKQISEKHTNIRFLFCGKGTDHALFYAKLKEYEIEEITYPLGLCKDIPAVLKALDLFYFPSVTEGQPNSLIEALLSGLPVVASNINPIREVMPKDVQHLLVDPLVVKEAVAEIEKHYAQKINYDAIALKAWATEKFGFVKNFKKFEDELK